MGAGNCPKIFTFYVTLVGEFKADDSYVWKGIVIAKDVLVGWFGIHLGERLTSVWYQDSLGSGWLYERVTQLCLVDL